MTIYLFIKGCGTLHEVSISTRNSVSVISFCGIQKAKVNLFLFHVTKTEVSEVTLYALGLWQYTDCEMSFTLPTPLPRYSLGGNLGGFRESQSPRY
jgi:hypothetical protein